MLGVLTDKLDALQILFEGDFSRRANRIFKLTPYPVSLAIVRRSRDRAAQAVSVLHRNGIDTGVFKNPEVRVSLQLTSWPDRALARSPAFPLYRPNAVLSSPMLWRGVYAVAKSGMDHRL